MTKMMRNSAVICSPSPAEAFEAAGIWGKDLHIAAIDGAVVITADEENDADA